LEEKVRFKSPIKKGDLVEVIHGKDRGKRGKVLTVLLQDGKAVVEGINMVKKHTRPTQKNPQGGIIDQENPVRISNLRLVCSRCNQVTRIKRTRVADARFRVRVCKKCGEIIDKV
jgi:large subunit ribosomal protein L24